MFIKNLYNFSHFFQIFVVDTSSYDNQNFYKLFGSRLADKLDDFQRLEVRTIHLPRQLVMLTLLISTITNQYGAKPVI